MSGILDGSVYESNWLAVVTSTVGLSAFGVVLMNVYVSSPCAYAVDQFIS